jgi:hypothetical protein
LEPVPGVRVGELTRNFLDRSKIRFVQYQVAEVCPQYGAVTILE